LPYSDQVCGIYKIVNTAKGECYVGQSQNVRKRIAEHFRLLRNGKHVNAKLQNAYNKYGEEGFSWSLEVICESADDLDVVEEAFISGNAMFVEKNFYNISDFAKAPMRGRLHTPEVREKIKAGRRATTFDYGDKSHREKMSKIATSRFFSDPNFVAKVKYIVENDGMTYAERGRAIKLDTSSVRKLYLKYRHMKGAL
jgi:group I intron endonuclease